jgi:hypothetical protein
LQIPLEEQTDSSKERNKTRERRKMPCDGKDERRGWVVGEEVEVGEGKKKKRDEETGRQMVKNLVMSDMVSVACAGWAVKTLGRCKQEPTSVETLWDVRSLQLDEVASYLQHTLCRH